MPDFKAALQRRLAESGLDSTLHGSVIEEVSLHLDERYRSLLAQGMRADEAERLTLGELDETPTVNDLRRVDALEIELRQAERVMPAPAATLGDARHAGLSESLLQDIRYAARALRKHPGFTAVAVLTLALGIGVNTSIFSVVNAVMLRPLPYGHPERLIRIFESNPERGWPEFSVSHPNYLDWRAQATSWEALAASSSGTASVTSAEGVDVVRTNLVTTQFLSALGISPALGRNFRPDEDVPGGATRVTILTDGFWRRAFGADARVLGSTVTLNGAPHTIIGILPPDFEWDSDLDLLLPLAPDPSRHRGDRRLTVIGLLNPGVTLDEARAELTIIAANLARQYPADNEGWGVRLVTFYDWIVPARTRESLIVLQGAVALVLLIACVNVANLLLARGATRQRELAIRVAVGASRGRLLWHGGMESLLLGVSGAVAGVGLAALTIRALTIYAADAVPRLAGASIDGPVLAYAALSALVSAALFGLIPSLQASRAHGRQVLQDTGRGTTGGRGRQRLRAALTVAEVALSVALLIGAGLLLRSFVRLQEISPGFEASSLMTGRVLLPPQLRSDTPANQLAFWGRLVEHVRALPGVTGVSTASSVPLTDGNMTTEVEIPGEPIPPDVQPSADWRIVRPGYFATMGIPLRGRDFSETDAADAGPYMIVSEALARRHWSNDDAIGKRIITRSLGDQVHTIIGVAGDVRSFGLDAEPGPMIYYSGLAEPVWSSMYLVWRSAVDPGSHVAGIRTAIDRLHPQVAFYEIRLVTDLLSDSFGPRRFNLYLLALFATVALALSSIGLFGVMAYLVSQRTREIGVRLALGARRREVFRLIVGRGVMLAVAGAALGVTGAAWLTQLMAGLLYSVSPTDPVTFVVVPLAVVIIAVIACYVPARRAMKVDPAIALRAE